MTADTAREDMDSLVNTLLGFAKQQLERRGEFYPFAAAISSSGSPQMVAVDLGEEHPNSDALIDELYEALVRSAAIGEIRASGVCADVRVISPGSSDMTDAIRASIERADAESVHVFLPYSKKRLRGYQFGELFAQPGDARVFAG